MRRRRAATAAVLVIAAGVTAGVVAWPSQSKPSGTSRPRAPLVLFATLEALACPAPGHCTAVGHVLPLDPDAATGDPDGDGQATHTLVDVLEGGSWHRVPSPDVGRGGDVLSGVSCPTADQCVAVGDSRATPFGAQATIAPPVEPLLEELSGGKWRAVPGPPAPPDTALVSVACPSASSCSAVGATTTNAGSSSPVESPFVETFDGSAWSVASVPQPVSASTELKAVSCPSVSSCVAVGDTAPLADPTAIRPLVEELAGGSWHAVSPTPASLEGTLDGVTCSAPGRCVAVGNAVTGPRSGSALVISSDASGWHVDPTALAQSGDISLGTVDCTADGSCVVAGISLATSERVLARIGSGGWQVLSGYGQNETVQAVVCPPGSACMVVGSSYVNGYGNTTTLVGSVLGDTLSVGRAPV